MGSGNYSTESRSVRATTKGYSTKPPSEIFQQRSINNAMDPHGIELRESRDSEEHPNSHAIIIALDVTGSMGSVPHFLVREGLPTIMEDVLQGGVKDPQVLFLGIGDHQVDDAPLQVGQFESSDELLDKWLTDVYLEGGGGANEGESYMLAWYFAGFHTSIDCFEKRKQKGVLFTIGDEPVLKEVSARSLKNIMGNGQYQNFTAAELLEKAQEMYVVFHIHIMSTNSGRRTYVQDEWRQLMGNNVLFAEQREDVATIIAKKIIESQTTSASPQMGNTDEVMEETEDML